MTAAGGPGRGRHKQHSDAEGRQDFLDFLIHVLGDLAREIRLDPSCDRDERSRHRLDNRSHKH